MLYSVSLKQEIYLILLLLFIAASLTCQSKVIQLSTEKQSADIGYGYDESIESQVILDDSDSSIATEPISYNSDRTKYLCRISFHNITDRDQEWILDFQNWSYVDVYDFDEARGISTPKQVGHLLDYNKRHYPFANKNYVLLDIPKDSVQDVLISLEATPNNYFTPSSLSIDIAPRKIIDAEMRNHERIVWMFLSIYIILFFYNLFVSLSVRDSSYIFYLIRAFCITYLVANNSGFILPIFSDIHGFPLIKPYLESFASGLNMICLILFTMSFLQTDKYLKWIHAKLKYVIIGIILLILGVYTKHPIFLVITLLYSFFIAGLIIYIGIASLIKKVPSSIYYVIAYSFSVTGILILTSVYAGAITPDTFITKYPTQIGYALELLFFSFALADKINVLKKQNESQKEMIITQLQEKQMLQANINKELEIKVVERTKEIQSEREKSESLLLNILPKATAEELKKAGKAASKYHELATIMLTDFTNFTKISSELGPELLVSELDDLFSKFDEIIEVHQLEKIKTIGDAYMAAGGLHGGRDDHGVRMVYAAKEMIEYLKVRNASNKINWNIRIGIHSGPVVSGVVGKKKFTFDTWGDTVNIASRLEQASGIDKINVSKRIADLLSGVLPTEHRGQIDVKGKGKMDMYFVQI